MHELTGGIARLQHGAVGREVERARVGPNAAADSGVLVASCHREQVNQVVPTAHGQNVTASAVGQNADLGLLCVSVSGLLLAGRSDFWHCS